jgi:uncharacterized protein (UPF0212 family)
MEPSCCPITLNKFEHPVVLPMCGHTIDKSVISKLDRKVCPICKTEFLSEFVQTNWALVDILGLEIKHIEPPIILSANKAAEITRIYMNKKVLDILEKINDKISKACIEGQTKITSSISSEYNDYIIQRIINVLRKEEYCVRKEEDIRNVCIKLHINWSCNCKIK